ncbi:MAG: adenylate kinase [candidate division Zixibacteria bacterium]|nr:adenylate kinase [candidate division Zixibacteria bacterium]
MKLIFLGPPGSGKGTQAKIIASQINAKHISTGDILREAAAAGTDLGLKAKKYMDAGDLVPDDVLLGLVEEVLSDDGISKSFILDGFPRTIPQTKGLVEIFDKLNIKFDSSILLDVPDDAIVDRLSARMFCANCKADFNLKTKPPKTEGICDKCGGILVQRDDDKKEVIENRLKVYHEITEPIVEFYDKLGVLKRIPGDRGFDEITQDILNAVS